MGQSSKLFYIGRKLIDESNVLIKFTLIGPLDGINYFDSDILKTSWAESHTLWEGNRLIIHCAIEL